MLSILIRTYDERVTELLSKLQEECQSLKINYEILISDDDPDGKNIDEKEFIEFPKVVYWKNENNLGRSNNLNKLISSAKFDYVLLLDNDVLPSKANFIAQYLEMIEKKCKVVYGGLAYDPKPPVTTQRLRWLYGHEKEAKSVENRKNLHSFHVLVSNLLINKSVFQLPIFDSELTTYGYEDLIFSEKLKNNNIKVCQIENPVIHYGLETSEDFIKKTEIALDNLIGLIKEKKLSEDVTKLSKLYFKLRTLRMIKLIEICSGAFKNRLKGNLRSKKPSLRLFNLYKLFYFTENY